MIAHNDNRMGRVKRVLIDELDGGGAVDGLFVVAVGDDAHMVPIYCEIMEGRATAYAMAASLLSSHWPAVLHDATVTGSPRPSWRIA